MRRRHSLSVAVMIVLFAYEVARAQQGACCRPNGTCQMTTANLCEDFVCDVRDYGTTCFGDVDANGVVNAGDRGFISVNFGQTDPVLLCRFDLDGNGVINPGDRGQITAYGTCPPLPFHQNGSGLNPTGTGPDLRFAAIQGEFHCGGATCSTTACGGACCEANLACTTAGSAAACAGFFQGDGTSCAATACGGACCTGFACVDVADRSLCAGDYRGDGTRCGEVFDCGGPLAVNDRCEDAVFPGSPAPYDNCPALDDDHHGLCGIETPRNSLWFEVTGDGTRYTVNIYPDINTIYDTAMQVWCGGCEDLFCVSGSDEPTFDILGPFATRISWCTIPGQVYLIAVGGSPAGTGCGPTHVVTDAEFFTCTDAAPCAPVSGACCVDGACSPATPAACADACGTYLGDGTACGACG